MTAPARKNTPAKAAPTTIVKDDVVTTDTPVIENKVEDTTPDLKQDETPETDETPKARIPENLVNNPILFGICEQYLATVDEIQEYNKAVLAEKDSEWNPAKVMEKARVLARPTEKDVKPNTEIADALKKFEDAVNTLANMRKGLLEVTAKELGITLSATATRDPETEAPLKEKRKVANEIGSQLSQIANLINDKNASDAVTDFLSANPLPAIGRDQVRSFGDTGGSTPKYRVKVEVSKDGSVLASEAGFTKAALQLTKPAFNYERGKAPTSADLREAWEKAGNTPEKTVTNPVKFEDNDLVFLISKS